jgi:hypothetical protein
MSFKQLLFNFVLLFFTFLCIEKVYSQNKNFIPQFETILLANNYSKVLNQCSRKIPQKIDRSFDLTNSDIETLKNNFKKILIIKDKRGKTIKNLSDYAYQYVGLIIDGKKYIYINAFIYSKIETEKDWKTKPIIVCDGGISFWGVLFDIEKSNFIQLEINGES